MEDKKPILSTLPIKSAARYAKQMANYKKWLASNHLEYGDESLQKYVSYLREKGLKASSITSMSSSILRYAEDRGQPFSNATRSTVFGYLKQEGKTETTKQSNTLNEDNITRFLRTPLDGMANMQIKVALIIAFYSAMRIGELHEVMFKDIAFHEATKEITVEITHSKTDQAGKGFTCYIPESVGDIDLHTMLLGYCVSLEQFILLKGLDPCSMHLFTRIGDDGGFINSPVGEKKLSSFPKLIAQYLGLPNASRYTGHCFRRSSATNLAENGATDQQMTKFCRWSSSKMAAYYTSNTTALRKQGSALLLKKTADSTTPRAEESNNLQNNDINNLLAKCSHGLMIVDNVMISLMATNSFTNCTINKIEIHIDGGKYQTSNTLVQSQ